VRASGEIPAGCRLKYANESQVCLFVGPAAPLLLGVPVLPYHSVPCTPQSPRLLCLHILCAQALGINVGKPQFELHMC
jgi:hypothetical protein